MGPALSWVLYFAQTHTKKATAMTATTATTTATVPIVPNTLQIPSQTSLLAIPLQISLMGKAFKDKAITIPASEVTAGATSKLKLYNLISLMVLISSQH